MKDIQRRLAAIMFTDIVGYTAMMQQDEAVANRLRERHREVFSKYTNRHEGQILQYFGDGTLSIYPSAAAAVECAVEIQQELKREPAVPIRIGIHTGDINFNENEVYGNGVNVASRIESLCIPGGVFISGKVYDDIKNHPRLRAVSLGSFELKNIRDKMEIFAIANNGITVPDGPDWRKKGHEPLATAAAVPQGKKKKFTAGLLALLFGMFGIHRFYLGQRKLGLIYLGLTLAALFLIPGLDRIVGVMAIIGFVDAILLWFMSRADFNAKFNAHLPAVVKPEPVTVAREEKEKSFFKVQFENYKNKALKEYREYDYKEAVEALKKAAAIRNDDPEVHFLLACCYSLIEDAEKALLHLDAAVGFGLKDLEKIKMQDDLAYLRMQPAFEVFVKNDYRLPRETAELSPAHDEAEADLLEQLNKLEKVKKEESVKKDKHRNRR